MDFLNRSWFAVFWATSGTGTETKMGRIDAEFGSTVNLIQTDHGNEKNNFQKLDQQGQDPYLLALDLILALNQTLNR